MRIMDQVVDRGDWAGRNVNAMKDIEPVLVVTPYQMAGEQPADVFSMPRARFLRPESLVRIQKIGGADNVHKGPPMLIGVHDKREIAIASRIGTARAR